MWCLISPWSGDGALQTGPGGSGKGTDKGNKADSTTMWYTNEWLHHLQVKSTGIIPWMCGFSKHENYIYWKCLGLQFMKISLLNFACSTVNAMYYELNMWL